MKNINMDKAADLLEFSPKEGSPWDYSEEDLRKLDELEELWEKYLEFISYQ